MRKYHMTKSHEDCKKVVHRPCSSCISSVQEINENSIEFSLSTQTWRVIKSSQTKSLQWAMAKCQIIWSTRVQCWTPAGGHNTVPGIQSTECQSCTNEWIFDIPFGPGQAGQCQVPIRVVACYACQSTLSWETPPGSHKGSIWDAECAWSRKPYLVDQSTALYLLLLSHDIPIDQSKFCLYLWRTRINLHPRHHIFTTLSSVVYATW